MQAGSQNSLLDFYLLPVSIEINLNGGDMVNEPRHKPQILIVEDDPTTCELMAQLIGNENHWEPTTLNCGKDAIEAWNDGHFDVILMDLRMAEMDGIEATKKIREHERRSGRKRTPIIAFTGLVSNGDRQECVDAGFDDFIAKPASLQKIIQVIDRYVFQ